MNIIGKFIKGATTTFIKNKPAIMTGIALVSLATTVIITAKEAPKIKEVADEKKQRIDDINADENLTEDKKQECIREEVIDGAKQIAVPVAKIGLVFGITAFSIFSINKAHTAREIAASALLESYKNQVAGYEEKIPALIGKQKAEELRHDVIVESADKMCEAHGTNKEKFKQIEYKDKVPMRDDFGNRWVSSKDNLDRAINEMEKEKNEKRRVRPINYVDFLNDHFDDVEIIKDALTLYFDPADEASVETTVYDDKFLKTIGYQVHFTDGAPVNEDELDGKY
jgi:hypothetical protein